MPDHDDTLSDQNGNPADSKFRFEFERMMRGVPITGLMYHGPNTEEGNGRTLITIILESGSVMRISCPGDVTIELGHVVTEDNVTNRKLVM